MSAKAAAKTIDARSSTPGEREAEPATTAPATPRAPVSRRSLVIMVSILAAVGAIFVQRAGRPIEQGGDAFSDGNALIAGRHFAELGFARLRFLPVVTPHPTLPSPARGEIYTRYPPGPDLMNGLLRRLGVRELRTFRLISAALSLLGLAFWFLFLRAQFDESVALIGLAAYGLSFPFVWLGDSVHHYAYSDSTRLAVIYLGGRIARSARARRETLVLAPVLLAQSLLGYDFIMFSQAALLGLGATGLRGDRLRRLVLFGLMPVLGLGLHFAQNAWALGGSDALADMGNALLHRAFSSGADQFVHYSRWDMVQSLFSRTGELMGLGLGTLVLLAGVGAAAWGASGQRRESAGAGRVLLTLAVASSLWFLVMYQHAAEHRFVIRHLLPFASLAIALTLRGVFLLGARHLPRGAYLVASVAIVFLMADGAQPYLRDSFERRQISDAFAIAYSKGASLPTDRAIATNINYPAPPALAALLYRRIHVDPDRASLAADYPRGARVIYLYSRAAPIEPELLDRLRAGRLIAMDEHGAVVEIVSPYLSYDSRLPASETGIRYLPGSASTFARTSPSSFSPP